MKTFIEWLNEAASPELKQYRALIRKAMVAMGVDTSLLKGIGDMVLRTDFEQGTTPEQFVNDWWLNKKKPQVPAWFDKIIGMN